MPCNTHALKLMTKHWQAHSVISFHSVISVSHRKHGVVILLLLYLVAVPEVGPELLC